MGRSLILLVYLAVAAFLIAHLINSVVAEVIVGPPAAPAERGQTAQQFDAQKVDLVHLAEEILAGGIFAVRKMSTDTAGPDETDLGVSGERLRVPGAAPIEAVKKVKLVGTVVGDGLVPSVVIEDLTSKRQTLYHLSDIIPNVGGIAEIRKESVVVQQGRQRELLELNAGRVTVASAAMASPQRLLDQGEMAQSAADTSTLPSGARTVPVYLNGKIAGWRIEGLTPQSFYTKIGFRPGDVLKRVNGVEINEPGMMRSLFQRVKDNSMVKVDLVRDGRKATLNYEIP